MRLKEDINTGPKNIKGDNSRIICTGERGDISGQVLFFALHQLQHQCGSFKFNFGYIF